MSVFFVLFSFVILISLIFKPTDALGRKRFVGLSAVASWLVLALRSPQCGTDLKAYVPGFENICRWSWNSIFQGKYANFETGYSIYNKIFGEFISQDVQLFLAFTAALCVFPVFYTIYRRSANPLVSVIVFLCLGTYLFMFSGIRQAMAIALTVLAYNYVVDRKKLPFIVCVALAASLHTSAAIFFAAWFLYKPRIKPYQAIIICVSYVVLVLPFLRSIAMMLNAVLFGDSYGYINKEDAGGAITMFIAYMCVYVASYFISAPNDRNLNLLRNILLFTVLFQSLGVISNGAITRIGYYYSALFCLFVPQFTSHLNNATRGWANFSAIVVSVLFFYLTSKGGTLDVVPYHFYWELGYSWL